MKLNEPYLIIDINDNKIVFFVISYDDNKNYKLIKNIAIEPNGVQNGKIIDCDLVSHSIRKTINSIEDELDQFFSTASIVINPKDTNYINISGYKKLNGSQVSKEDITYILNDIKKIIISNEDKHSVIHLFNSSFSLDSDNLENLPIGLFGEFYNQNMTFFLINKNIIKNLKLVFSNCGVNIDRVILKSFVEGINFLLQNVNIKNFTTITLENRGINISLFKNKSFVLTQDFSFGIDLIIKDISKLCSLKINEVETLLKEIDLKSILEADKESFLDKIFFSISPYRKIKHQLILDIISARLDELIEISYEKNSNLNYFRKTNETIYINVENTKYFNNIQYALQTNEAVSSRIVYPQEGKNSALTNLNGIAELIGKGWEKEAIPVIQSKKSIFSSFFSKLFS